MRKAPYNQNFLMYNKFISKSSPFSLITFIYHHLLLTILLQSIIPSSFVCSPTITFASATITTTTTPTKFTNIFDPSYHLQSTFLSYSTCQDNPYYKYHNNSIKTCTLWVQQDPINRCQYIDYYQNEYRIVKELCPYTCGACPQGLQVEEKGEMLQVNVDHNDHNIMKENDKENEENEENEEESNLPFIYPNKPHSSQTKSESKNKKKNVGQYCTNNNNCQSNRCFQNICYQSSKCQPLKHYPGQTFDTNTILFIFVGSGFTNLHHWRLSVYQVFDEFSNFEFLQYDNPLYTAFYVDDIGDMSGDNDTSLSTLTSSSFCEFQCHGIPSLLCCQNAKARELSQKCFPAGGAHIQTIVIENSKEYGGGGYFTSNIATTSLHELGSKVAVHELGHSLFELGDEYMYGTFTAQSSANCDTQGCSKWADLNDYLGGNQLCSTKGCQNGDYYVGEVSFMTYLDKPFGEVNTRYTCCTYLAFTGFYPKYCSRYESVGDGLLSYCQQDHQGYGVSYSYQYNHDDDDDDDDTDNNIISLSGSTKYVLVAKPAILLFNVTSRTFIYETNPQGSGPSLYRKRMFYGDYNGLGGVIEEGLRHVHQLTLHFDTEEKVQLFYSTGDDAMKLNMIMDSPLTTSTTATTTMEGDDMVNSYSSNTNMNDIDDSTSIIEIVVDARMGIVVDIDFKDVTIHWYTIIFTKFLQILDSTVQFILHFFGNETDILEDDIYQEFN